MTPTLTQYEKPQMSQKVHFMQKLHKYIRICSYLTGYQMRPMPFLHEMYFLRYLGLLILCQSMRRYLCLDYYVSQFTVETYCFADGRCLFKQPQSVIYHWNQYHEEISKKCRSVRPSVCLFVCKANKKAYSFIIDSRKIVRI